MKPFINTLKSFLSIFYHSTLFYMSDIITHSYLTDRYVNSRFLCVYLGPWSNFLSHPIFRKKIINIAYRKKNFNFFCH